MINKAKEAQQQDRFKAAKQALEALQENPILAVMSMAPETLRLILEVTHELPQEKQRLDTLIGESGTTLEELETKISQREARLESLDEAVVAARAELMAAAKG